jgi:hypothetical protein
MSITVQLDLPEEVAAEARAAGLLEPCPLAELVNLELQRRRAGRRLSELMDQMHAVPGAPMSMEEIDAEVKAVRAARRAREAGR